MARLDICAMTHWIGAAALRHPRGLGVHVAQRLGLSRGTANKALRRLVELNWLTRHGSPQRPCYEPGLLRQVVQRYALDGLQEDQPWSRDYAPVFRLPPHVQRMVQHSFTELLNNAIEHSAGHNVTVSMRQTPNQVQLLVSDDGRGLFDKLRHDFGLDDPCNAMLELSKGKLTSAPQHHSGRGLYFTSKLADVFDLHANAEAFQRREWEAGRWVAGRALKRQGTSVYAAFALDTTRTLDSVLQAHSVDGKGYGFERTVVPLRLMLSPLAGLESRAQARRVSARLDQFALAEVDFEGVPYVGHGFADELFRVQALQAGSPELRPVNMCPAVASLVASIRHGAA